MGADNSNPEQYHALRAEQAYRCGICGISEADVDLTGLAAVRALDGLLKVPFAVEARSCVGLTRQKEIIMPVGRVFVDRVVRGDCGRHISPRDADRR